jgi:hypothetical protein
MAKSSSGVFDINESVMSSGVGLDENHLAAFSCRLSYPRQIAHTSFVWEVSLLLKDPVPDVDVRNVDGGIRRFGGHVGWE